MSTESYVPAIGLEVHCELKTRSKMFCACPNGCDQKEPNADVCPICLGHPGTLPTANIEAIKLAVKTGLALGCVIQPQSKFDRKNYFYPDLPKGYQISQYDQPFCLGGSLSISQEDGKAKEIRIRRVHLEEDTARLIHPAGADLSLVDFNRSGVPLMELVTEPDIATAHEARQFAEELQMILRYLNVSDADMEKGKMRVEVNISVSVPQKGNELGTKVEIKNLNSLRAVEGAVAFEISRQTGLLEAGEKIKQETRGWNESKLETYSQRDKEEAFDYRYFPEPDLVPCVFNEEFINLIRAEIGELPMAKRQRFIREYSLNAQTVEVFVRNRELGSYFEKAVSELENWIKERKMIDDVYSAEFAKLCKLCSNYLVSDVIGLLKGRAFTQAEFKVTPENFAEFITMISAGDISSKIAKTVLEVMMESGQDPSQIIEERGLSQVSDEGELSALIAKIIENNAKAVADYASGKENAFQYLTGQILGASGGKANPGVARELLKKMLDAKVGGGGSKIQ